MAWIVERENTTNAVVNLDVEPPCAELIPPIEYFKERDLMYAYGQWTRVGIDIEDRFWPISARLRSNRKSLPDLIGICSFWAVSENFMMCVESAEPGIHDFRNVDILCKDGTIFHERYYALNIRNVVSDAVVWNGTEVPSLESGGRRKLDGLLSYGWGRRIIMDGLPIKNKHLMVSQDTIGGSIMVSNDLHEMLARGGLLSGTKSFMVDLI